MINLNLLKSKKTSRIQLQPLISRPNPQTIQSRKQAREFLFLSPQPHKSGFISGGSSPKNSIPSLISNENLPKFEKSQGRQVVGKRQTPPDIRKIEIDWKKISANETHAKELSSPQAATCRRTTRIATQITKNKFVGIPARYKTLNYSKSSKNQSEFRSALKASNDLDLIKLNSKEDISQRVLFVKERYLEISKNLPLGELERNWKWRTPEDSESDEIDFI